MNFPFRDSRVTQGIGPELEPELEPEMEPEMEPELEMDSMFRILGRPVRRDSGSVTVEMVLLAPVLVLLTLFIVFLGRAGGAAQQVRHAADVGARAASQASRSTMHNVAASAVTSDLADNGVNCASTGVSVVVNGTLEAGSVTVTVTCTVNTDGTSLLGVGARAVSARSTEVIDRYRSS